MSLNLVSEHLLAANGLSHQDLFSILGQLTERRLDYGDLYFQSSYHESWVLEDSIIKDGSYNIDQGVGVRAVSGEKTGFAYADQISLTALEQSAQAARTIVRDTGDGRVKTLGEVQHSALYTSIDPLQSMSREEKLDILRRVDSVARAADNRVQEFVWAFGAETEEQIEKQILLQIEQLKESGDVENLLHGRWSHMEAMDEDEWLEHLEEHLKEIVNISGKDEKTLARRLEEHRREVHDRIATEHPELAERFKERRHVLDEHLKKRRPEVYELVVSLREKEETDLK